MSPIEAFSMVRDLEYITHSRNECSYATSYDMADCILGTLATGTGSIKKYHTSATVAANLVMTVDDLPVMQVNDYIVIILSICYREQGSSSPLLNNCYSLVGPIIYGTRSNISVPCLPRSNNLECFIDWSANPLTVKLGRHETREGIWDFDLYVLH